MRFIKIIFAVSAFAALAGCLDTDGERALVGAGAGAVVAETTGGNVLAGAAVGAAAGALCDDAGVCN
ncbi:MAG: hypothetical protein AAGA15_07965 [Pseudomonadota bacterium]